MALNYTMVGAYSGLPSRLDYTEPTILLLYYYGRCTYYVIQLYYYTTSSAVLC